MTDTDKSSPSSSEQVRVTSKVVRQAALALYRSRLPQMAAALAFRTIFSLIPVIIVLLVVMRFFTTSQELSHWVERGLEYTGIAEIAVDEDEPEFTRAEQTVEHAGEEGAEESTSRAEPPPDGAEQLPPPEPPTGDTQEAEPDLVVEEPDDAADWINALVQRVIEIKFEAIGFVGMLTLLYAAISMLLEIERAFNMVYRASQGRPWGRRITLYWTILTLGGVFLFASFYVGERFKTLVQGLADSGVPLGGSVGLSLVGFGTTVAISTFLFVFMYNAVPYTKVRFKPALAGAFVAAILWETGKWGFTQYLSFSASYARLYGSIALIPLFLLWIYLTWLIVLFGLQVSYALQFLSTWNAEQETDEGPTLADPALAVVLMAVLTERFREGRAATLDELAAAAELPENIASSILDRLRERSFVHVVQVDEDDAYALARAPEELPIDEILRSFNDLARDADDSHADLVATLRARQVEAFNNQTLAGVLAERKAQEPSS